MTAIYLGIAALVAVVCWFLGVRKLAQQEPLVLTLTGALTIVPVMSALVGALWPVAAAAAGIYLAVNSR